MSGFKSFATHIEPILRTIIAAPDLHGRWLNTLSYMENCGAKRIASCEHPTMVREEMLKHAAEEFGHAHYLKQQIVKVYPESLPHYAVDCLLGGFKAIHYLGRLNIQVSRHLRKLGIKGPALRERAYALVSCAIEYRAKELYPIYQGLLAERRSNVTVRKIIVEEEHHLEEMQEAVGAYADGAALCEYACAVESELCGDWLEKVQQTLNAKC